MAGPEWTRIPIAAAAAIAGPGSLRLNAAGPGGPCTLQASGAACQPRALRNKGAGSRKGAHWRSPRHPNACGTLPAMPRTSDDPYDRYRPIPIYVPVEVTRVARRIAGYHGVCRACGKSYQSGTVLSRFCSDACRQSAYRLRKRLRARLLAEAEEERITQVEALRQAQALRRRRRLSRDPRERARALLPATGAPAGFGSRRSTHERKRYRTCLASSRWLGSHSRPTKKRSP